ncbi:ATP-binding protein [Cobetia amphilecti]|uniref:AAA family ATPase n=1 Tax=Cobetia amphilecti TaxID=1055104 RepID=UPI001CDACF73|nr:AAA family ATPase [Cobetia amphilecti]UBU50046.1 ATP-binding protein [Cobetia amphilecti]
MSNYDVGGIVKFFKINGLHGYKDLSIDFAGESTVLVAENGVGKTTLLSILSSTLKREIYKLNTYDFDSIECHFASVNDVVVIKKKDLALNIGEKTLAILSNFSEEVSIPHDTIIEFVMTSFSESDPMSILANPIGDKLFSETHYDISDLHEKLCMIYSEIVISGHASVTFEAFNIIKRCVGDTEVIYLPTYRRVERPLKKDRRRFHQRSRRSFGNKFSTKFNYNNAIQDMGYDDIAFGLADVEQQLGELTKEIQRRSNFEYGKLSARMLDELLGPRGPEVSHESKLPELDSLKRFLSRVQRQRGGDEGIINKVESLYEEGSSNSDEKFVRFFLSRLGDVIAQTKEIEDKIERFVDVCNEYLQTSSDQKKLQFDPDNLKVKVTDTWDPDQEREIDLDDLSSGEKQIISLMSYLYLNDTNKILLIDEPELSLSIDWQRKVLPDVMLSGSVSQLLAITHSPFIFENDLDSNARAMIVKRSSELKND